MKATILYKTDFNHSYASRDIIGVFTNKQKFEATVKKIIKEDLTANSGDEGEDLKAAIKWNTEFFFEKNQTQGLSSFEIVSEDIELNTKI